MQKSVSLGRCLRRLSLRPGHDRQRSNPILWPLQSYSFSAGSISSSNAATAIVQTFDDVSIPAPEVATSESVTDGTNDIGDRRGSSSRGSSEQQLVKSRDDSELKDISSRKGAIRVASSKAQWRELRDQIKLQRGMKNMPDSEWDSTLRLLSTHTSRRFSAVQLIRLERKGSATYEREAVVEQLTTFALLYDFSFELIVNSRETQPEIIGVVLAVTQDALPHICNVLERFLGSRWQIQGVQEDSPHDVVLQSDDENAVQEPRYYPRPPSVSSLQELKKLQNDTSSLRSILRFAQSVDALTASRLPSQALRVLQARHNSGAVRGHLGTATELVRLFERPEMIPYISTNPCAVAFDYLGRAQHFPEARRIFLYVDAKDIYISPRAFNVFLRQAARSGDLQFYKFALDVMLARGIRPTLHTWVSFVSLTILRPDDFSQRVVRRMEARGLLEEPHTMRQLAKVLVRRDLSKALENNITLQGFLEAYDERWQGSDWLGVDAANQMFGAIGQRGNFPGVALILEELEQRGGMPDVVSVNQVLANAVVHGSTKEGITIATRMLDSNPNIKPDQVTFNELFKLSWRRRNLNLWRVIWRYACLGGYASSDMLRAMGRSLRSPEPTAAVGSYDVDHGTESVGHSRTESFRVLAARIAIGITPTTSTELAGYLARNDDLPLISTDPADKQRFAERRQAASRLIAADEQQYAVLAPTRPFADMLREALTLDLECKAEGLTSDLPVMLQRAIEVPVQECLLDHETAVLMLQMELQGPFQR